MSLNGLDAAPVLEAHEAVAAEPGGWFLLKYASRDEVELLSRGHGGIAEARKTIAEYEETSPLYGFLKYRRRNVVIKYLPEGCSRLIQARVAVHFNAVCERFSPYDTTFEITEAEELKDSKLSAACSLHAASASNASSSSSLRRRRLMEIAEEEEEEPRATKRKSTVMEDGENENQPKSPIAPVEPVTLNSDLATSPEHAKFSADTTSHVPNFVGIDDATASPEQPGRTSTQSARPDFYSSYPHSKPRIKLGPRPSVDANVRPQTAGNFQPVSSIPAGVKLFGKGHRKAKSREHNDAALTAGSSAASVHTRQSMEAPSPRPGTSSGLSTASTIMPGPSIAAPGATNAKPTITPEKARLMKAMQLREKKKLKMMSEESSPTGPTGPALDSTNTTSKIDAEVKPEPEQADHQAGEKSVDKTSMGEYDVQEPTTDEPEMAPNDFGATVAKRLSMVKADSGVVLEDSSSVANDEASEQTLSDSRPHTPVLASSEAGPSTKASSVSGSTDETVHAKDDEAGSEHPDDHSQTAEAEQRMEPEIPQPAEPESQADVTTHEEPNAGESQEEAEARPSEEPETGEIIIKLPVEEQLIAQNAVASAASADPGVEDPFAPQNSSDHSTEIGDQPVEAPLPKRPRKMSLPISKFSANGTKTKPTVDIPPTSPPTASATTTPTNEVGSPQRGTPKSRPSTQDLRAAAKAAAQTSLPPPLPLSLQDGEPEAAAQEEVTSGDKSELASEKKEPAVEGEGLAIKENSAKDDKGEMADDEEDPLDAGLNAEEAASTSTPNEEGTEQPLKLPILSILTDRPPHSRQISRSGTESHLSDDDELMDELQSATVQEATSMTVAKTPVSPVFPTSVRGPATSPGHLVRTISNPLRASAIVVPDVSQSSARSVSSGAAYLHKVTQQQTNGNLARKNNVGSSISQRIKALERLSVPVADAGAGPTRPGRERPQSTFFSVKKTREPSRSPSVVDRASPFRQDSTPSSRDHSPDVSRARQRDRSLSVASRLTMFESPPRSDAPSQSGTSTPRGRPETVSVTAKIVRDPSQKNVHKSLEPPKDPSEFVPLDLKQSLLVVDHQKAQPDGEASGDVAIVDGAMERTMSPDPHRSEARESKRRSSLTVVRDFIKERRKSVTANTPDVASPTSAHSSRPPSAHHSHTIGSRLSISSRRSLSKDRDIVMSPTIVTEGSMSGDESKSSNSDKKKSRTGRFMRRLSELSSSRGKTSLPHAMTVTEEELLEPAVVPRPSTTNTPAVVSDMGDVNVQFPDTLLWKRRHMRLDAQGFLTLSAPPGAAGARALTQGTKRYHLSDFRQPYAPDLDAEELPNSVVLDLIEGSGVQVACEDRSGQMHVLHVLREAHANHATAFAR